MTRDEIVQEARSWVGAPYRHQGRSKDTGVDCIGLASEVLENLGFHGVVPRDYSDHPDGDFIERECDRQLVRIGSGPDCLKLLQPGALMIFWFYAEGKAQHFAWFYRDGHVDRMIHAFAGTRPRRVVDQAIDNYWKRRLVAAYDIPGVTP